MGTLFLFHLVEQLLLLVHGDMTVIKEQLEYIGTLHLLGLKSVKT